MFAFLLLVCGCWNNVAGGRIKTPGYVKHSARRWDRGDNTPSAASVLDRLPNPLKALALFLDGSAVLSPASGFSLASGAVTTVVINRGFRPRSSARSVLEFARRQSLPLIMNSGAGGENRSEEEEQSRPLASEELGADCDTDCSIEDCPDEEVQEIQEIRKKKESKLDRYKMPLIDGSEHQALVDEAMRENKVIVINFLASWCNTCRAMAPKLQRVSQKFPEIEFFAMDFDANSTLTKSLGIKALPFVEVISGKQGKVEGFTCSRGKIMKLLASLETSELFMDQSRLSADVDLPADWLPYLTAVDEIGSGNFGKVFIADMTCPGSLPRRVAVKDLQPAMNNRRLLMTEMAAISDIKEFLKSDPAERLEKIGTEDDYSAYCEPLLIEPQEAKDDGHYYLPMPFCNQGEFRDILRKPEKVQALGGNRGMYSLLLHVARAVKVLHGAGWVHNDLHAANVLVDCDTENQSPGGCVARLIDLGMALKLGSIETGARAYSYSMSPEVVAMGYAPSMANVKSDVWQLGILLWEIAIGRETVPSRAVPKAEVHLLIPKLDFKDAPFPELAGVPEIQRLLRGMLTQDVELRWSMDQVIEELEKVALPEMKGPHKSTWLEESACLWCETRIPDGSVVEIAGMVKATELNGANGVIERYLPGSLYQIRLSEDNLVTAPAKRLRVIE